MSAFNASFSCGGGGASGPTGTITSLVPPTDNIGEEGNLYIQFGIGGAKNMLYLKQGGVWVQYSGTRSVLTLNGVSQYAVAPRIDEIDLDDPNLEFEVEWTGGITNAQSCIISDVDSLRGSQVGERFFSIEVLQSQNVVTGRLGGGPWSLPLMDGGYGTYSVRFSVPNSQVVLYKDGVEVSSKSLSIGESRDRNTRGTIIAARGGSTGENTLYQGQLRDLKIWTGGDRNTGTLTRHYRMDEGWRGDNNQVLVNYATELGEELIVNGTFDTDLSGWIYDEYDETTGVGTEWEDGRARLRTPSTLTGIRQSNIFHNTVGSYLLVTEIDNSQGGFRLDTITPNYTLPDGKSSISIQGISNRQLTLTRNTSSAPTDAYLKSISAKQADGYGTYVGLTEASWTEETV